MKRNKFLAALLTLVMLLSLVPVTALATDAETGEDPVDSDIRYGSWVKKYSEYFNEWGIVWSDVAPNYTDPKGENYVELPEGVVSLDKRAEKGENPYEYNITLEVVMEETTTTTTTIGGAATVLAIDCSGSMGWCAECGKENCNHWTPTYQTVDNPSTDYLAPKYYIKNADGTYQRVYYCHWEHKAWYTSDWDHTEETKVADSEPFYIATGSSRTERIDNAKDAARKFLASYSGFTSFESDGYTLSNNAADLSYGRYLAIVLFETNAKCALKWVDVSTIAGYKEALKAIDIAYSNGGTNLDAALKTAKSLLADNTVKNIAAKNTVALTDGEPTYYDSNGKSVKDKGNSCGEQTFKKTIDSANALKNADVKLYTVCFASGSEEMTDYNNKTSNGNKTTYGKITLANYLAQKIATQPAEGSDEKYAYAAADANELSVAFERISNSITTGLSAGTVVDILPEYVSTENTNFSTPVHDEDNDSLAMLVWNLTADTAEKGAGDNGKTIYTWTYDYTVTVDPDSIGDLDPDSIPLNQPTTLTVNVDGEDKEIGFPIPCVKLPTPAEVDLNGDPNDDGTGYKGLIFKNLSFTEGSAACKKDGYDFEVTVHNENDYIVDVTQLANYTGTIKGMQPGNSNVPFSFVRTLANGESRNLVLSFWRAGTYTYTITETVGDDDDIIYDTDIITMTVEVALSEDGKTLIPAVSFTKTKASAEEEEPAPTALLFGNPAPVPEIDPELGEQFPEDGANTFYNLINTVVEPTPDDKPIIKPDPKPDEPTTGNLTIEKSVVGDDLTAVPEGYKAVFKLVKNGETVRESIEVTAFTGLTGSVTVEDLAPGTYTVVETYASEINDYTLNKNVGPVGESHEATVTAGGTASVTYTNCYNKQTPINPPTPETGSIKITKVVEIEGLETLPENYTVTFAVKSGDETVKAATISSFKKTENGFVGTTTIEEIDVGTYEVVEQDPPAIDGYRGPTFKRDENNTAVVTKGETAEVTVTNAYVSNQPSEPIKPPTPETHPYTVNYYTSDDGENYDLHSSSSGTAVAGTKINAADQVKTITGYTYDHASHTSITVSAVGENVLKLYYKKTTTPVDPEPEEPVNPPYVPTTGSVDIRKTDAENGSKLAGATFSLYRVTANGDVFVASVTTNTAGQATASALTPGKYVAIETVAPEGYVLDDTRHEFTVTAGAVATKLTITNEKADSVNRHEAYIIGYPDGTVRPTGSLSRAEAATIFFRLLADDVREANMTSMNPFSDVPAGLWCNHAISTLYELGIIDPAETFRPDDTITRSEFAALAERFGKVVKAEEFGAITTWVGSDTHYAAALGLSNGSFPADEPIARAEAMALVNRVLGRVPQGTGSLLANMITWPDNTDVTAWFYIAVQEATNSHDANKLDVWQVLRAVRDWAALEF